MLTTERRSSLYNKLVPTLGKEDAAALLDEYPASELQEPATKAFVHAEFAGLRSEWQEFRGDMRAEFASLRSEWQEFRGDMKTEFASLQGEWKVFRGEMVEMHTALRGEIVGIHTALEGEMAVVQATLHGEMQTRAAAHDAKLQELNATIATKLADQTKWVMVTVVGSLGVFTGIVGLIT